MNVAKLFNKVFIQVDAEDNRFDECIKALYKNDTYVSAHDFFIEAFNITIINATIIEGDTTYLIIQLSDAINIKYIYAISSECTIYVTPYLDGDTAVNVLTVKIPI